jgi:hypothetical protein
MKDQHDQPPADGDPTSVLSGLLSDWLTADAGSGAIRTFSEVNRRGFEAAGRLIATMTEIVDGVAGGSVPGGSGRARPAEAPTGTSIRREILTSIDMWAEVMGSVVETSFDMLHNGIPFGREDDSVASAVLGPLRPGQHGSLPLYAHSITGQGLVRCRVGTFESAGGVALEPGTVSIDPDILIEGSGHQITVRVEVPESAEPGRYHGFVFAEGVTEAAVAVEIVIVAS